MKIFIISVFIILNCMIAYADDFFTNKTLNELNVIKISVDQGYALVEDKAANNAEVYIGDRLGAQLGIIVEINKQSITVQTQTGKTKTKLLLYGSGGIRSLNTTPSGAGVSSLRTD